MSLYMGKWLIAGISRRLWIITIHAGENHYTKALVMMLSSLLRSALQGFYMVKYRILIKESCFQFQSNGFCFVKFQLSFQLV